LPDPALPDPASPDPVLPASALPDPALPDLVLPASAWPDPASPDVAVVVLNYNGRALLPACLGSLAQLRTRARLVVADNGSSDGSLDVVREQFPGVETLDLGRSWGFAAGYNEAIRRVDHPWLVLLNNDASLEPDWIEQLLCWAADHPAAGILGGKLLFQPGQAGSPPIVQSAGASITDAGTAFEIGWGAPDNGQFDQPRPVGAIPGAAMLVQREVFQALGGFDASYGAYLEDVDLCWRAWLSGREVHYVPGAVAHHQYGASGGGRSSPYRIRLMQRNRLANMVKNLEAGSLARGLAVSVAYDAYRVLEYLRRGDFQAVRALAGGTRDFGPAWRAAAARRKQIQRSRVLSDRQLRQRGLLVPAWSAFREYRRLQHVTR
jgi:N-acetylglucosaminyl-diphospho-decaprenol L-rhamnosyltransferase